MEKNNVGELVILVRDVVGGIARYTHEVAQAVALQGVSVTVICKSRFPDFPDCNYTKAPVLLDLAAWGELPLLGRLVNKMGVIFEHVIHPIQAFRICHRRRIRCLHLSNAFHLGYFVWRLFRREQDVLGLTVHDVARRSSSRGAAFLNLQLGLLYREASLLLAHDDLVTGEIERFASCGIGRMFVVPHGIYRYPVGGGLTRWVQVRNDLKTGLFFGAVRDEKRLDLILHALAGRKDRRDWRFIVAGSEAGGQHKPIAYYEELAVSLGVGEQVQFFRDYIPDEAVHHFFECADWVALVYSSSFTSQSGVLATSVSFGVPVLTSNAPLLKKTVLEYDIGINSEGDRPIDLLNSIGELELRGKDGFLRGCERFDREMSWSENARIMLTAYRRMSGEGG
jgi:glycosyltransferase involved in cell wall biosynthesis